MPPMSATAQSERVGAYRTETGRGPSELRQRFGAGQLEILEKVNRADLEQLGRLRVWLVPTQWPADELAYTTLPYVYQLAEPEPKMVVVYVPGQMFGAYESGRLIRWGPVSSGERASPTPEGVFFLNWKATGHISTVNPEWFLRWYFNFGNREGLAFHQYSLPGGPASHGCIRLLGRDAEWLFNWGEGWTLDATGSRVVKPGTAVLVVGAYDFDAPPPWHSRTWLRETVPLPPRLPGAGRNDSPSPSPWVEFPIGTRDSAP